jgi:hypothetical protein
MADVNELERLDREIRVAERAAVLGVANYLREAVRDLRTGSVSVRQRVLPFTPNRVTGGGPTRYGRTRSWTGSRCTSAGTRSRA